MGCALRSGVEVLDPSVEPTEVVDVQRYGIRDIPFEFVDVASCGSEVSLEFHTARDDLRVALFQLLEVIGMTCLHVPNVFGHMIGLGGHLGE